MDLLSTLNNLKYNLHLNALVIKIKIIEKAKSKWFIQRPGHSRIDCNEKTHKVARETVNDPLTKILTYSQWNP